MHQYYRVQHRFSRLHIVGDLGNLRLQKNQTSSGVQAISGTPPHPNDLDTSTRTFFYIAGRHHACQINVTSLKLRPLRFVTHTLSPLAGPAPRCDSCVTEACKVEYNLFCGCKYLLVFAKVFALGCIGLIPGSPDRGHIYSVHYVTA